MSLDWVTAPSTRGPAARAPLNPLSALTKDAAVVNRLTFAERRCCYLSTAGDLRGSAKRQPLAHPYFRARRCFWQRHSRGREMRNIWLITASLTWVAVMSGALWVMVTLY
jgi:hypothetical protein